MIKGNRQIHVSGFITGLDYTGVVIDEKYSGHIDSIVS